MNSIPSVTSIALHPTSRQKLRDELCDKITLEKCQELFLARMPMHVVDYLKSKGLVPTELMFSKNRSSVVHRRVDQADSWLHSINQFKESMVDGCGTLSTRADVLEGKPGEGLVLRITYSFEQQKNSFSVSRSIPLGGDMEVMAILDYKEWIKKEPDSDIKKQTLAHLKLYHDIYLNNSIHDADIASALTGDNWEWFDSSMRVNLGF